MREESAAASTAGACQRITPAHAGRIGVMTLSPGIIQDHPRACGKNALIRTRTYQALGSPPRMREESELTEEDYHIRWITPAHAGRIAT